MIRVQLENSGSADLRFFFFNIHSANDNNYANDSHKLLCHSMLRLTLMLLSRTRHNLLLYVRCFCSCFTDALCDRQVTRLQYLNALMASRVGQSPDPPEIKILPNSQTKLLNDRNTTQGSQARHPLPSPQRSAATCWPLERTKTDQAQAPKKNNFFSIPLHTSLLIFCWFFPLISTFIFSRLSLARLK